MTSKLDTFEKTKDMHVLIIGAGVVGFTIAQGCRENGIPFTIFERDEAGSRAQGWALWVYGVHELYILDYWQPRRSLHWCMRSLERTIGAEIRSRVNTVCCYWEFLFTNPGTHDSWIDIRRPYCKAWWRRFLIFKRCDWRDTLQGPNNKTTNPRATTTIPRLASNRNRCSRREIIAGYWRIWGGWHQSTFQRWNKCRRDIACGGWWK